MNKNLVPGVSFWAKKFDKVACITSDVPGEYRTLCGKYNALLGNNYAPYIEDVCPNCLRQHRREPLINGLKKQFPNPSEGLKGLFNFFDELNGREIFHYSGTPCFVVEQGELTSVVTLMDGTTTEISNNELNSPSEDEMDEYV